jgi:hypothetical protein
MLCAISSWIPVYADAEQRLGVMSIAFLLSNKDDAIIWRGPKKTGSRGRAMDILPERYLTLS